MDMVDRSLWCLWMLCTMSINVLCNNTQGRARAIEMIAQGLALLRLKLGSGNDPWSELRKPTW